MKHLISISAVCLAAFALSLGLWLGWTALQHNLLSVRPYVTSTPYLEGPRARNGLYLSNIGLGPAIVRSATIIMDGTPYDLSGDIWEEALLGIRIEPMCFTSVWLPPGTAIEVGQEIALLSTTSDNLALCLHESIKLLSEHQIGIALSFESLYGEQLTLSDAIELTSPRRDYARALKKLQSSL